VRTVGQMAPSMLGLSYVLVVFLSRMRPKGFTRTNLCGMKGEVTGARILLSLSHHPDTGTGSGYPNRTFFGALTQPLFKQASPRLTPLHTCDHAVHGSQPAAPQHPTYEVLC
jgi:hypothetical protein